MKSVHGLALVAVLAVGILLGTLVRGGVERVSRASPVARIESLSGVHQEPLSPTGRVAPAAPRGESCTGANDCTDYVCSDDLCQCDPPSMCSGGVRDGSLCSFDEDCPDGVCREPCFCSHPYSAATCPGHLRETHLVTAALATSGNNARSIGIWGECFDETLGPTVPLEECVFTVEAVQYRRDPLTGATKFDVICVDLDDDDSVPTCSPMEREPLAFSIGPSMGPHFGGQAGVAAGVHGAAWAGFDVDVGFSAPINIHRRFRYPMFRRFTGRVGGNILIDSGIGSVVAKESVVFGHNGFDGHVTYFVTKPQGMQLTLGYKKLFGDPVCTPDPCPVPFAEALRAAAGLLGPSSAVANGMATVGDDEFESDFDIEEVKEALDDETQAIEDIIEELKNRIEQKIAQTFEMLREFLGQSGSAASTAQQSVLVDQAMDLLRERIRENLREIREITRDLVTCPDN